MHAYKGWLEEGLCREEHSSDADLWLDGRQPSEEFCELGFGGKADDLTNEAFGNFCLALRIATPLDQLPWKILPQLVEAAAQLQRELAAKKAVKLTARRDVKPKAHKRNKKKAGLRVTDPW